MSHSSDRNGRKSSIFDLRTRNQWTTFANSWKSSAIFRTVRLWNQTVRGRESNAFVYKIRVLTNSDSSPNYFLVLTPELCQPVDIIFRKNSMNQSPDCNQSRAVINGVFFFRPSARSSATFDKKFPIPASDDGCKIFLGSDFHSVWHSYLSVKILLTQLIV